MRKVILALCALFALAIVGSAYVGSSSADHPAIPPVAQAATATPNNTCAPGEDCARLRLKRHKPEPHTHKAHKPKVRTAAVVPAPAKPKAKTMPIVHRWSESATEGRLRQDIGATDIE